MVTPSDNYWHSTAHQSRLLDVSLYLCSIFLYQITFTVQLCLKQLFKYRLSKHSRYQTQWLSLAHLLLLTSEKPIELREGQVISTTDGHPLEVLITTALSTLVLVAVYIATQYLVEKKGPVVYRWSAPVVATTYLVVRSDSLTQMWLSATYVTPITSFHELP